MKGVFEVIYVCIYFAIGLLLAVLMGYHYGNFEKYDIITIIFWPFIMYWSIKWFVIKIRVHRLEFDDIEGFCKLMKIHQIVKARNKITRCYIYTITFKNRKEERYTVYDQEVIDALMDKDNGIFSVLTNKILYKKETK